MLHMMHIVYCWFDGCHHAKCDVHDIISIRASTRSPLVGLSAAQYQLLVLKVTRVKGLIILLQTAV